MTEQTTKFDARALFGEYTLVRLNIGVWTAKREVPLPVQEDRETEENGEEGTPEGESATYHGRYVRLSHPKYLKPIKQVESATRKYLDNVGKRFFLAGSIYLVANAKLSDVTKRLGEYREAFLDAVEHFIEKVYLQEALPEAVRHLQPDEKSLCPEKDALYSKFSFTTSKFVIALPEDVMDEKERASFWSDIEEFAVSTNDALKRELWEMLVRAHETFSNPARRLFDSSVTNVVSWCERFPYRNIWKDRKMEEQTSMVLAAFRSADVDAMRADDEVRVDFGRGVKFLLDKMKPLMPKGDDIA